MNTTLLGFFRHQFVASPLKRLLWMVPLIAVMAFGPFVVDSALSAAFLPSMVTVLVLVALQQEDTAYTAFGVPRSRAVKLAAIGVVPAVLCGVGVALAARPDWVGLLGALFAVVAGLLIGTRYVEATNDEDRRAVRGRIGRGGFIFEVIFKPQLLWAAGIAVAHSLLLYLAGVVSSEPLAQFLVSLPILVWAMVYCSNGTGILGATAMTSFGVPRRRWLVLYWGAALASVALYMAVLLLVAPIGLRAILALGAAGLASAVLGAPLKVWRTDVGLIPAMFLFFAVKDTLLIDDPHPAQVAYALAIAGLMFLIGLVLQALFVFGVINPKQGFKDA